MTGRHRDRTCSSPLLATSVVLWAGLAAGTHAAAQGSAATDRAALEALYDATGGPGWTDNTNWKTSAPLGEWFGVTTDARGRVTRLALDANGLAGSIPAALSNLGELKELSLQLGDLTGPIPAELGRLANLQNLDFEHNDLTGPIPAELGELANLYRLDIAGNDLTGPVPTWLGNLTGLWWLDLGHNDLTGPIPAELGNLVNLEYLLLRGNDLTGPVPTWLGNLTSLRMLRLGSTALTGSIPVALGGLTNLETLDLSYVPSLTGPVPTWLGNLTRLRSLHLPGTALTGPIPVELGGLTNLETLDLSYSWGLSGPLPPGLQLSRLEELDIFVTQVCAPAAWRDWLATIEFLGPLCGSGTDVTIDVAVFHTPAARVAAGGAAAIAAVIDLMIAETNQAYAASGVHHRVRLVARSEVAYDEDR